MLTRRGFLQALFALASAHYFVDRSWPQSGSDHVSQLSIPGVDWMQLEDEGVAGWDAWRLGDVRDLLKGMPTTSFMIVSGGKIVFQYGNIGEVSYLASARKSILSILYGKYVLSGVINLRRTIGDLGLTDVGGLLPIELNATIENLLTSTSGVYHPAGSPGSDLSSVPARGSKQPGTYFYYNNWDFNVAGAVFERLTGKTVFEAFRDELSGPLGMQDYEPARQRMLGQKDKSQYEAYHFFLSARDMARIGLMMVRAGRWGGRQVVPEQWVVTSTSIKVSQDRLTGPFRGIPLAYGYLWWLPQFDAAGWSRSFLAYGNYGQFILGLPMIDTVIVHRRAVSDDFAIARNLGIDGSSLAGVSLPQFLKVADAVLAARTH
jgi:CubicO group peptidase (beta-lactamase class C family)